MTGTVATLTGPAEGNGTELTRFNALRHGILSRYTVLPWEDEGEYAALVASLVEEHAPQGPTEEHLVEELAGILWRKRRLRWPRGQPTGAGWMMLSMATITAAEAALAHITAVSALKRLVMRLGLRQRMMPTTWPISKQTKP